MATARILLAEQQTMPSICAAEPAMQRNTQKCCGMRGCMWCSGDHPGAETLARELLELADHADDRKAVISAHIPAGLNNLSVGRPTDARRHLSQAVQRYEEFGRGEVTFRYGMEFGGIAYAFEAWSLAILGYLDQAHASIRMACRNRRAGEASVRDRARI